MIHKINPKKKIKNNGGVVYDDSSKQFQKTNPDIKEEKSGK